jgi:16S rRNA (cytidine1402-2'-O)-methyltransferase
MPGRGQLYLVPTPIGNLGDMTSRALDVLGGVDLVACEDTRVSGRLLRHFGLKKKLLSYHDFNESARAGQLTQAIEEGRSVAVVTDAGSPGISDPAYRVVRAAIEAGIEITALPGPTAIIPALTASGLPTDRFFFEGFLPVKDIARRKRLEAIKAFQHTLVFYESPHRIQKTLSAIAEVLGDRRICLAREISKKFEQYLRGSVTDVMERISGAKIKGEIVIVVAGYQPGKTRTEKHESHET